MSNRFEASRLRAQASLRRTTSAGRPRSRSGFTALEVLITIAVFTIGISAVSSTLLASRSLNKTTRETSVALEAAESAMETLRGEAFEEAFARFNATDLDDPAGGNSPGIRFAVDGLRVREDDEDGFVGEIIFPGNGVELREDFVDDELGMPRDLDGDGNVDANDHSGDYVLLPVRVRLEWTGQNGNRFIELNSVLFDA